MLNPPVALDQVNAVEVVVAVANLGLGGIISRQHGNHLKGTGRADGQREIDRSGGGGLECYLMGTRKNVLNRSGGGGGSGFIRYV